MIEILAFSTDGLRRDAVEVEGWGAGNEAAQMRWAADEIERLRADLASEREACAKFLDDCARNRMPADVAKLLRHEASGIRNGIHRMEPK